MLSCEMDVRVLGGYRRVFAGNPEPIAFFGKYREATAHSRLSWGNDESPDGAIASESTQGFTEQFGQLDDLPVTLRRRRGSPIHREPMP